MTSAVHSTEEMAGWEPVTGLPSVLYCESISDDEEGLAILLAPPSGGDWLRLVFTNPYAYQNVNESFRSRTWLENPARPATLLTIKKSRWVKWLKEESGGVLDEHMVTHYAIYTPEDCIDVISQLPPDAYRVPPAPPRRGL